MKMGYKGRKQNHLLQAAERTPKENAHRAGLFLHGTFEA